MDTDLSTVNGVVDAIMSASQNRQYQLLGALLILVTVMASRKIASKTTGKFSAFVMSDLGGVTLSIVYSSAGAVYQVLKNGAALSVSLVVSAVVNAALASGLFTYGKHTARSAKKGMARRKAKRDAAAQPPPTPPDASITTTTTTEVPK